MANIRVTFQELASKGEELQALNASFKAAVGELESLEEALSGMWEGEAKDAFRNAFRSDKVQMDNFYNAIEVYVQRLNEILNKYVEAENTNVGIAETRNY